MSMSRFSPAASMKTTRLAILAGMAVALFALGMSASPAKAGQPHKFECSKNVLTLVIICDNKVDTKIIIGNVVNIGEINVVKVGDDLTVIDGDLTVVKVGDVLSNNKVKCVSIVIAVVNKQDLRGVCNGPN